MIRSEKSKSGNVIYTIDEDRKEVTATIFCTYDDPFVLINSKLKKYSSGNKQNLISYLSPGACRLPRIRYRGRAKCHPDDVFDIEFGKKLALLRAKDKYLKAMNKCILRISEWMLGFYSSISDINSKEYIHWIYNSIEIYNIEKETGLRK